MVSNEQYPGHLTGRPGIRTVILIQALCGICSGSLFNVDDKQSLLDSERKSEILQNSPIHTSENDFNQQAPLSCPNMRNPFTFFSEKYSQNLNEQPVPGDEKEGAFQESSFLKSGASNSNFPKTDFPDSDTNNARTRQLPYINQSSKMFYQYQQPGHPPVKMLCYYNSNNGLGNYYICRGKGGDARKNAYFQVPKMYLGVQNTLKNTVKNHVQNENCGFSNKNFTACPKTKFPDATSICKEDLSLIMNTLSPIYDWAQQKHREVSDIDRYECLIDLIDGLKCRIADEKNKYLASLSESSPNKLEKAIIKSQEINNKLRESSPLKPLDEQNIDGKSSVKLGEGSSLTQTLLVKKNEESNIIPDLDPVKFENSGENLTCLKIIKRQVYPSKCDCGYFSKKTGRCPCGSWPSNQRRYYGA